MSESAQCSEKQQSPCEGEGGIKCLKNNQVHTYNKFGHMFPCILYFFIHPKTNKIGLARQQPRDWDSLFNISESGWGMGWGRPHCLLALRLLDYMGFALEATTEWKMGRGHTLQPNSIGTGGKCPPTPNSRILFGRGHKSVLPSTTKLQEI